MRGILDNPLLVIAIALVAAALIGALVSLLALLRPLRRLGRRSARTKEVAIGLCVLLALGLTFGLGTRLFAAAMVSFATDAEASWRGQVPEGSDLNEQLQAWDENRRVILNELWLRQMAPPTSSLPCYTRRFAVCEVMGELGVFGTSTWGSYALFVGLSAVSALVAGTLAWLFLRRSPRRDRRDSGVFVRDDV